MYDDKAQLYNVYRLKLVPGW